MTKLFKFLALTAAAALFGCSSSSSGGSSTPPPTTRNISGVVSPSVAGSVVELWKNGEVAPFNRCGVRRNTTCRYYSGNDGTFIITVDINEDVANFYIVTYGGIDAIYDTNLEGVSLSSPAALFIDGSGELGKITVSPITSLVNYLITSVGYSLNDAAERTADFLEITADLLAENPLDNNEVLVKSYLVLKIAQIANAAGVAEPLERLAGGLAHNDFISDTVSTLSVLDNLFNKIDYYAGEAATAELRSLATVLLALDTTAANIKEQIVKEEGKLVFKTALINSKYVANIPDPAPGEYDTGYAEYSSFLSNTAILSARLAELIRGSPQSQFAARQALGYVISVDAFFGEYSNYHSSDPDFTSHLNSLVTAGDAFIASLKSMAKEDIYFVTTPLSEPLGNDNAKRLEYYFRSNADVHYKAKAILAKVKNDEISDSITDYIVDSYSLHGFHERAKGIADYYIIGTINKIKAYRSIGFWTAVYDKPAAKTYLDAGKSRLDASFAAQTVSSAVVGQYLPLYIDYMSGYDRAGEYATATAIRTKITSTDLLGYSSLTAGNKRTHYNTLLSRIYSLINNLIDEGNSTLALSTVDYYLNLAKDYAPDGSTANYKHSPRFSYISNAAVFYRLLATDANSAAIKIKIVDIKALADTYVSETVNKTSSSNGFNNLAYLAGSVYWAMGESVANDIISVLETNKTASNGFASRVLQAAYEIAIAKAEVEGFDSALAWYQTKNPVAADFSNLNTSYSIIDAFSYYNDWDVGMGVQAHRHGRNDIAEDAANHLVSVLNSAAAYFEANSMLAAEASAMIAAASEIYPQGGGYPINSADRNEGGYLKAATIYSLVGNTSKAKETLLKAEDYVDKLTAPYTKGQYYSVLGYYYQKLAGSQTDCERAYIKADAELSKVVTPSYKLNLALLLSYNAFYRTSLSEADRSSLIDGYLQTASTLADAIYTGGVNDPAAEEEISALLKIAARYSSINDNEKVRAALEKAESTLGFIAEASTLLNQKKEIYTAYAKLYSIDSAVEKANTIADTADRNSVLQNIATAIVSATYFPNSGRIAFSDTDKDGKPDFFVPWTAEYPELIPASGLTLDDDIDGDGKPDTTDLTPFFAD
jgi:hypothetical protein